MSDLVFEPVLWRAVLFGIGLAVALAPLGCLLIWRNMSFFADALSHTALLAVAVITLLGLIESQQIVLLSLILTGGLCLLLPLVLRERLRLPLDATLAVLTQISLAMAIILISVYDGEGSTVSLYSLLFGDILSVFWSDVVTIWLLAGLVVGVCVMGWPILVTNAVSKVLSRTEGSRILIYAIESLMMLLLLVTVSVALPVVGTLVLAAFVIVPVAAVRPLIGSPEAMVLGGILVGAGSSVAGMALAVFVDTPAGPTVVSVMGLAFVAMSCWALVFRR